MELFCSPTTRIRRFWLTNRDPDLDFGGKGIMNFCTWGMARLAMVMPDTRSDRKGPSPYSGAHWKIGKKYCRPRKNLRTHVWFLNRCSGSSGKKISPSLCLSFCGVVRFGGMETLCTSRWGWGRGRGSDSTIMTVWCCGLASVSLSEKLSTLLEFTPIGSVARWDSSLPSENNRKMFSVERERAWKLIYRALEEGHWGLRWRRPQRRRRKKKRAMMCHKLIFLQELILHAMCMPRDKCHKPTAIWHISKNSPKCSMIGTQLMY